MKNNPRYSNGHLRRKHRARLRAMGLPCAICGGRFGDIHYDEPSDYKHPLSFVIDEKIPVSRWKEFGYESARACAEDWNNLQPAHYICNAQKSNKLGFTLRNNVFFADAREKNKKGISKNHENEKKVVNIVDGDW